MQGKAIVVAAVGTAALTGLWWWGRRGKAAGSSGGKVGDVQSDKEAFQRLKDLAKKHKLDIKGGEVRRSSSRFCLGVEHGDYNGTELFGVGTDRFIWLAYKRNNSDTVRIFSDNFADDGVITFKTDDIPPPQSQHLTNSWARFPLGVFHVLAGAGLKCTKGFDAVITANIPGGGMSRSASLTLNLLLTTLEVNCLTVDEHSQLVDLAVAVENDYIGSPCGNLDQIMILYAKAGYGTHYLPKTREVIHIPLGSVDREGNSSAAKTFRIVALDTGTVRPGLEKSTYAVRRRECDELVEMLQNAGHNITSLADIKDDAVYRAVMDQFADTEPALCARLTYIYNAQKRFYDMMAAWNRADMTTVGALFRADGHGLRDEYAISGPELQTMCDVVRTVPGVLGERMLGGGDKGAAGALVRMDAVGLVRKAVELAFPRAYPALKNKYAMHVCQVVDGITDFSGMLES